jgi:hypothetical protein
MLILYAKIYKVCLYPVISALALTWYSLLDIFIRGGSRGAHLLKLEKIWFFGVKSWFFTRNTPNIFAPPSAIGKNMIFWRKIVIFHTKYPKACSRLPPLGRIFLITPPLTWNPGSAPVYVWNLQLLNNVTYKNEVSMSLKHRLP